MDNSILSTPYVQSILELFFHMWQTRTDVLVYDQSGQDQPLGLELCLEYEYIRRPIYARHDGLSGLNLDKVGSKK